MDNVTQEPNKEQTPSIDSLVDQAFEAQETPQESSPAQSQPVEPKESVTDTTKTEAPKDDTGFEGVDKGFANHPAWQKREEKLKEAQGELDRLRPLLDDPVVFKRHLERNGYSKQEIDQVMRERGMATESPQPTITQNEVDSFAKTVCQKKGWDYDNLSGEQKSYIRDLIGMTDTVFEMRADSLLSKRLKPLEDKFNLMESQTRVDSEVETAKGIASKYKFDFDKDILPTVQSKLNELDKIDPLHKIKFDVVSFTKDMVLQLVEERGFQQVRQEERKELKTKATPLKPGASQPNVGKVAKGKTVGETVDSYFDAAGIRG